MEAQLSLLSAALLTPTATGFARTNFSSDVSSSEHVIATRSKFTQNFAKVATARCATRSPFSPPPTTMAFRFARSLFGSRVLMQAKAAMSMAAVNATGCMALCAPSQFEVEEHKKLAVAAGFH